MSAPIDWTLTASLLRRLSIDLCKRSNLTYAEEPALEAAAKLCEAVPDIEVLLRAMDEHTAHGFDDEEECEVCVAWKRLREAVSNG